MDLTFEEFELLYTGFTKKPENIPEVALMGGDYNQESVDWRSALPPVKNQG